MEIYKMKLAHYEWNETWTFRCFYANASYQKPIFFYANAWKCSMI